MAINPVSYSSFIKILILAWVVSHFSNALANGDSDKTRVSGVIMLDYALVDGINRELAENASEFNSQVRKARLNIKHQPKKNWMAKLQLSFSDEDNSSEIGEAYIRYKGSSYAQLTIGKFKEPFGLENMTSSKSITFLERSMVTKAFSSGKSQGFMVSGSPSQFNWGLSVVEIEGEEEGTAPFALGGRFTWAPLNGATQVLHLGTSFSIRDMDGEIFEINERIELHSAEKIIESGEISVDQLQLSGVEVAFVKNAFSIQGEYFTANIKAVDTSEDTDFNGYYIQGSWFLTDDKRKYKKGIFSMSTPSSIDGAWELTGRYSELNTQDVTVGNKVNTSTLGLNYYYDKNVRLTGNLLYSESSQLVNGSRSGNAISFRAQYQF